MGTNEKITNESNTIITKIKCNWTYFNRHKSFREIGDIISHHFLQINPSIPGQGGRNLGEAIQGSL